MTESEFQLYKTGALVAAFALSLLVQWHLPLIKNPALIFRNWKTNVPLASVTGLVTGVFCGSCVCAVARYVELHGLGLTLAAELPLSMRIAISVPLLDVTAYFWHRANHRLPVLWRFHSVHHSDEVYDASTAARFHPGEVLISLTVRALVVGLFGLPIVGILLFEIIYAFFNAFEHGNIELPEQLDRVAMIGVVTPQMHRVHHSTSVSELNSNYGTIFAVWDRAFGTHKSPEKWPFVGPVGLPEPVPYAFEVIKLLGHPFRR